MPLDHYFTSAYKSSGKRRGANQIAAQRRARWPREAQFTAQVHLEMRGGERPDWWHFLSVPADQTEEELTQWRDGNPGFEFRRAGGLEVQVAVNGEERRHESA